MQSRLANRLTGFAQDVYFLLAATSEEDNLTICKEFNRIIPKDLGYQPLILPMYDIGSFSLP